ncbi:putative oxidoreductase dhs-27 [Aphelenchoides besseyi]|nr:putative oxidoreductase dhs-27 [Aphelenchoides besseyi]
MPVFDTVDCLDENLQLNGTGYTMTFVLKKLSENSSEFSQKLNESTIQTIDCRDLSGDGKGYLSRVFKLTINFTDNHVKAQKVVLKIPTLDRISEACDQMELLENDKDAFHRDLSNSHNNECYVYELINTIDEFPTPRLFFLETATEDRPGIIVMEDLSDSTTTANVFDGAPADLCFNIAKHFAQLQAAINTTPDLKQKSEKLNSAYHLHCNTRELVNTFFGRWCAREPSFEWFAKKFESLDLEALSHFALIGLPQEYGANTLIHGDCWINNLLLKQNSDGTATNEISRIIDFQLSFSGNPLFDLARLIQICVDSSVRRKIEKSVVDVYYNALRQAYKKRGYKQLPFSREQASFLFDAHELYAYAAIHQAIHLVMIMYFLTAQDFENDPQLHQSRIDKMQTRLQHGLEDGLKRMNQRKIFEKFSTK